MIKYAKIPLYFLLGLFLAKAGIYPTNFYFHAIVITVIIIEVLTIFLTKRGNKNEN